MERDAAEKREKLYILMLLMACVPQPSLCVLNRNPRICILH